MDAQRDTSKRGEKLLKELAGFGPFLPVSLAVTKKRCGRKTCRCAKEGPIHPTAHITWKEQGETQTLHVPKELIEEVTQWVETWKKLKRLIGEMGREQRQHLQQRKKSLRD